MTRSTWKRNLDYAAYAWLLWVIYKTVTFYFVPYKTTLKRYQRSPKAYALVTGASGGIGLGFAQELLRRGFGVIILANNEEKLTKVAASLKSESPGATVETISFDVRQGNYQDLANMLKPFLDLPITLLVNNVGGITVKDRFVPLTKWSPEEISTTINMNAQFITQCTRILLPTLIRNGPSAIISLGSTAAVGAPWMGVYAASKAYVTSFATSLAREARAEGWKVDSVGIVPGDTHSEFNQAPGMPGAPTSRQFAKTALDRIEMAVDRRMIVVAPDWKHALQLKMTEILPESVVQFLFVTALSERKKAASKRD